MNFFDLDSLTLQMIKSEDSQSTLCIGNIKIDSSFFNIYKSVYFIHWWSRFFKLHHFFEKVFYDRCEPRFYIDMTRVKIQINSLYLLRIIWDKYLD